MSACRTVPSRILTCTPCSTVTMYGSAAQAACPMIATPAYMPANKFLRRNDMFRLPIFDRQCIRQGRLMLVRHQFEQTKSLRHMKAFAHRRLPGDLMEMLMRTLAAEQIHPQSVSRRGRTPINCCKWNTHRAIPNALLPVDLSNHFESGIPFPAIFVMRIV